jgi:hypothetical protein
VSPFIVTTKRRLSCTCWGTVGEDESGMCRACHARGESVSRLAVATLEEAKAESAALLEGHEYTNDEFFATALIPESGGTVGPLPDGTTIHVEPRQWYQLAEAVGWHPDADAHRGEAELLAAYNAKQGGPGPSKCGPPGSAERGAVGPPNPTPVGGES